MSDLSPGKESCAETCLLGGASFIKVESRLSK